ncbi:MAG: branched-chain amino acid ABC transporter substrate-binding protein [Solirubrobacteraceae bacterium]
MSFVVVMFAYGGVVRSSSANPSQGVLDIYSSLPLHPTSSLSVSIVNGIRLALAQAGGKAGQFTVHYISLDDSTAAKTTANARRAASDPAAAYYIGELDSGASEISIPILNKAGVPQISPSASYDGLTTKDAATAPEEPGKYYPTGKRTFLRIASRDTVQAAALLTTMSSDGCQSVAVANDQESYGQGLAALMQAQAAKYGVHIISNTAIDPVAPNYDSYIQTLERANTDCFMFAGFNGAVKLTEDVAAAIPTANLYGGDAICASQFTNPAQDGIPASAGRRFKCTTFTLPLSAYPGGPAFLAAYKAKYGASNPDPYAILGYEAMKLALNTSAKLGARGNNRSAILRALFATRNRHSVLGTYGFDRNGDTTLRTFGLYNVSAQDGLPTFVKNVMPR